MSRYSIIQGDAPYDTRLTDGEVRILSCIGSHTGKSGWCWLNQKKLADRLKKSRETVNRAVSKLTKLGFLEKVNRQSKEFGDQRSNICLYRVRMDYGDAPQVVAPDDEAVIPESHHDEGSDPAITPGRDVSVTPGSDPAITPQGPLETRTSRNKDKDINIHVHSHTAAEAADDLFDDEIQHQSDLHQAYTQGRAGTPMEPEEVIPGKKRKTKIASRPEYTDDFYRFWEVYPSKKGKADAAKSWKKMSTEDKAAAIAALYAYKRSDTCRKGFIQHASTYLNKRTYDDYAGNNHSPVLKIPSRFRRNPHVSDAAWRCMVGDWDNKGLIPAGMKDRILEQTLEFA